METYDKKIDTNTSDVPMSEDDAVCVNDTQIKDQTRKLKHD